MKSPVRKAASSFPSRTAFPIWTGMIPSWSCTRAAWLTTVLRKPCCITSAFPRWRRFTRSSRIAKALPGAGPGASTGIPIIPVWNRKGKRKFFPGNCRIRMPSVLRRRRRRGPPENPERNGKGPWRKAFRKFPDSSPSSFVCWGGAGASFSATVPSWFFNWSWCCCFPCW